MRVLLVYGDLIPSVEVCQLRSLRCLAAQNRIELKHGPIYALPADEVLTWCDVVIFCRCCLSHELSFLLKAQALRIPYLYDLDDNFFRLADTALPGTGRFRWAGTMKALRAFVAGAAFVKVGSPQLQEDVAAYNPRCVVHPLPFDFSILRGAERRPRQDQRVYLGYAGNRVHAVDLEIVAGAVRRILTAYGDRVFFTFYGPQIEGFAGFPNVRFVPYLNNYQAFLRDFYGEGWDIALAPLHDTLWNRSKTNIKYIEYAACGIAGVYSDMPLYNTCVRHGVNGMLCADTEDAWYNALTALIEDPALLDRVRESALQDVKANYSVDAAAERLWEELIVPAHANGEPVAREERRRCLSRGILERSRRRAQILCGGQDPLKLLFAWTIAQNRRCIQWAKRLVKRALYGYAQQKKKTRRKAKEGAQ